MKKNKLELEFELEMAKNWNQNQKQYLAPKPILYIFLNLCIYLKLSKIWRLDMSVWDNFSSVLFLNNKLGAWVGGVGGHQAFSFPFGTWLNICVCVKYFIVYRLKASYKFWNVNYKGKINFQPLLWYNVYLFSFIQSFCMIVAWNDKDGIGVHKLVKRMNDLSHYNAFLGVYK